MIHTPTLREKSKCILIDLGLHRATYPQHNSHKSTIEYSFKTLSKQIKQVHITYSFSTVFVLELAFTIQTKFYELDYERLHRAVRLRENSWIQPQHTGMRSHFRWSALESSTSQNVIKLNLTLLKPNRSRLLSHSYNSVKRSGNKKSHARIGRCLAAAIICVLYTPMVVHYIFG